MRELIPSHALFTSKTVDPCRLIIRRMTTPMYPRIPIARLFRPPLLAKSLSTKSPTISIRESANTCGRLIALHAGVG